jgi:hypothetical protein
LLVLSASGPALAYCQTTTCDRQSESCRYDDDDCNQSGLRVRWLSECLSFAVQREGSDRQGISGAATRDIIQAAFDTWSSAGCPGGGAPSVEVTAESAFSSQSSLSFQEEPGNSSVWLFRDAGWPYPNSSHTLALSTLTLDLDHGRILDVDVEINSADYLMTTTDENVGVDFKSIVTHEAGHFLGLDHSPVGTATMFEHYDDGDTSLRELADDDVEGICAIYPPRRPSGICETDAYRAAAIQFQRRQDSDGCHVSPGVASRPTTPLGSSVLLTAALASLIRRRISLGSRRRWPLSET